MIPIVLVFDHVILHTSFLFEKEAVYYELDVLDETFCFGCAWQQKR
jgi:hypothetical protein